MTRRENLVVRLSRDELEALKADAAELGHTTVSEYVRALCAAARKRIRPAAVVLDDGEELPLTDRRVESDNDG